MEELRHRAAEYLLGFPGVHAVGARRKVVGGITQDRPALSVYVARKQPTHSLQAGALIPREILGCPTDVFQQPPPRQTAGEFANLDERREVLEGGFAIESNDGPGAATLGCIATVTEGNSSFPVALTCNHVLSKERLTEVDSTAGLRHALDERVVTNAPSQGRRLGEARSIGKSSLFAVPSVVTVRALQYDAVLALAARSRRTCSNDTFTVSNARSVVEGRALPLGRVLEPSLKVAVTLAE